MGRVPRYPHIIDNAETAFVYCDGIVHKPSSLLARHSYVQYRNFAFSDASFHLCHLVAGREKALGQFDALSCEQRCQLGPKGKALLDGDPKISAQGKAQSISQSISWMTKVLEDLGDCTNINHSLDETETRGKPTPALDDRSGAKSIQRHIDYPRQNDKNGCDSYRGIHAGSA
jgi:hypothetical protein